MSRKWRSIPRIVKEKTPTQATLWPSASTRLDNSRIILSQSVLSGCGHCSHPAEAQIWSARTAHVHATGKHFDCCWHKDWWIEDRHICISWDDADRLAIQLAMMRQQNWQVESVDEIAKSSHQLNQLIVRSMFDQVEQLVRLLLTIPCSSAEAERSFSSLRRLKT